MERTVAKKFKSVASRIRWGTLSLALIPLLLAVLALGTSAYFSERARTEERIYQQLSALREVKAQQVRDYFDNIVRLLQQTASAPLTVESAKQFNNQFAGLRAKAGSDIANLRNELKQYYTGPFTQEFSKRNGRNPPNLDALFGRLSDEAVVAQHIYIASNQKPLGKKGELDFGSDGSEYSKTHAAFHPFARTLVEKFGLYDFFLIDPASGNVVYSYFKELDFGTSLDTGPWSKSGLAEAFQNNRKASKADQVWLTDFAPYFPSYNDQAVFISVPVFDGAKVVSVAVVQVPIDQVNQVMTFDKKWESAGLGKTGESYLVGIDNAPRSISRGMVERTDSFVQTLKALLPAPSVATIEIAKSDIGLRTLESEGIRRALAGQTSSSAYENYFKQPVLGSYGPLNLLNQRFGLLVEIEQSEAYAPLLSALRRDAIIGLIGLLVLGAIATLLARQLTTSVTTPLKQLEDTVMKLQSGDFNARVQLKSDDEFGSLGRELDKLLDDRVATLEKSARENEALNESVVDIMQAVGTIATTKDLTARVPVSDNLTGAIADAMNLLNEETSRVLANVSGVSRQVAEASETLRQQSDTATQASIKEQNEVDQAARELGQAAKALGLIAERALVCNESAERAMLATQSALRVVNQTVDGVSASRELIRETEKRIKRLGERSQEIGQVVNIIQNIAERTGILALNASMHAASAGEAGRSFSLVADEVKRLSESARDSTAQIARLIGAIQNETKETVITMNQAISQVVEINRMADAASEEMVRTQQETSALVDNVRSISSTSQEQARVGTALIERARIIQESSAEMARQLAAQAKETRRLTEYSRTLLEEVSVFKLPQ